MKEKTLTPIPGQLELISAICKKFGNRTATARQYNAIIKAVNDIIEAVSTEDKIAKSGAGYQAWLKADDRGMSSEYMAQVLARGSIAGEPMSYPRDSDDFGRCYRMLRVCPELRPNLSKLITCPKPWPGFYYDWEKLEKAYESGLEINDMRWFHQLHSIVLHSQKVS